MRKWGLFIIFFVSIENSFGQNNYWQQYLRFNINVELNDIDKTLTGDESIVYKNYSPDTLGFIWFHIYPNAYKNESTALFEQIKSEPEHQDNLKGYSKGSIKNLAFTVNGVVAKTEPHPNKTYIDIIKVILPAPLLPGDSVQIQTPFEVQLPSYFSRLGFAAGEFMACQWYPKPAVFDKDGWHEMPYLDMGEFYSEYASYKVNITLPSAYVVSATGLLQNEAELQAYKTIGALNALNPKKAKLFTQVTLDTFKTLSYVADSVPDFAWFADKSFFIQYDTIIMNSGNLVDAFTFYHEKRSAWMGSIAYVKDAVRFYSRSIGEYAYPIVQAVDGPKNSSSGGMEYPMVTIVTMPDAKPIELDAVIAHEVGHNWFMSMLGTNERTYPWMDEGLNTYFEMWYEAEKYRTISMLGPGMPKGMKELEVDKFIEFVFTGLMQFPFPNALSTPSSDYSSSAEYGSTAYLKGATWMFLLQRAVGKNNVNLALQQYFRLWKNKHPKPDDMQAAFEQAIKGKLNQFFGLLNKTGKLEE